MSKKDLFELDAIDLTKEQIAEIEVEAEEVYDIGLELLDHAELTEAFIDKGYSEDEAAVAASGVHDEDNKVYY